MYQMETGTNVLDSPQQAESIDSVGNLWEEVWFCGYSKKEGFIAKVLFIRGQAKYLLNRDGKTNSTTYDNNIILYVIYKLLLLGNHFIYFSERKK